MQMSRSFLKSEMLRQSLFREQQKLMDQINEKSKEHGRLELEDQVRVFL